MGRLKYKLGTWNKKKIECLLSACNWNISLAMKVLGLSNKNHFYGILKSYDLVRPDKDAQKLKALETVFPELKELI